MLRERLIWEQLPKNSGMFENDKISYKRKIGGNNQNNQ